MNQNSENIFENKNNPFKSELKEDNIEKNELIFQQALDFHQKGNIEEAKKCYIYLIKKEPIDQRALVNLGAIFHQLGEYDKAIEFYNFSIKLNPNFSDALYNLGLVYLDIGKLFEAEKLLKKSLILNTKSYNALFYLISVLVKLEKYKEAKKFFEKIIDDNPKNIDTFIKLSNLYNEKNKFEISKLIILKGIKYNPDSSKLYTSLGNICFSISDYDNADKYLKKALAINPKDKDAYIKLGILYLKLRRRSESIALFKKAFNNNPRNSEYCFYLGSTHLEFHELSDSINYLEKAVSINPKYSQAFHNLGVAYRRQGDLRNAKKFFKKTLSLNDQNDYAHYNLGIVYDKQGFITESLSSYEKALKLNPKLVQAIHNIGCIQEKLGKFEESLISFNSALKTDNNHVLSLAQRLKVERQICLWSSYESIQRWHKSGQISFMKIQPRDLAYLIDDPAIDLKVARELYHREFKRIERKIYQKKNDKIHICYFSSDFRNHPVSYLLVRVLELHDKSKFKIFAYSLGSYKEDDMTLRIKKAVNVFRDLKNLSDEEIFSLARKDNIDISIDLLGYTGAARPSIFSLRTSPIQISYLGFAGTMGHDMMDYILADKILIPEDEQKFYSEKILHMKNNAYCCDDTLKIKKSNKKREDYNLPENGFIFACFNNNFKISPVEFDIWMNLLKNVKNSYLWLKISNDLAKKNLIKEAKKRGISSEKIIFAEYVSFEEHIQRQILADLFLDTFNYNAGSTAVFSLLTGLPLLALYGKTYHARLSSSLLINLGLNSLVAGTKEDYEKKGIFYANNPKELKKLRVKLQKEVKTSKTFKSKIFTKDLESIYEKVYKDEISPKEQPV